MSHSPFSPQLLESLALAVRLNHPELADPQTATKIHVRCGEGSPGDLRLFPQLQVAYLERWSGLPLASFVEQVPGLEWMTFWESDADDLAPLAGVDGLTLLEVRRGLVTDLRPIEALPRLEWFSIVGCPLDEHSYREILPRLTERGVRSQYAFDEREWRMCRKLQARGLRVSAFPDAYGKTRLLVPGWDRAALGTIVLTEEELDRILADHPDLDTPGFMAEGRRVFSERRARERE